MVTSIARQSVIIKSKTGNSILLGNYECGYALGLLSKVAGLDENESFEDMRQWHEHVMSQLDDFKSPDERLTEVLRITKNYEPDPEVDEQVKQLYRMGYGEERMWQM
ncbi:MAG: DUF3837 domain-containing protein [Lachnospiraceae bacterium]|nr:DUF3837 domain-containing protein [Lachnospiraceae bacterium]